MIKHTRYWVGATLRLSAVVMLAFAGAGCSDMLTYAGQNRDSGIQAYRQGNYPEAVGAFRNATRQDPRDYLSHYWLGISSLQLNNNQQAIAAFRTCLETRHLTAAGREDDDTRMKAIDGFAQSIVKTDDSDLEVNALEKTARNTQGLKSAEDFFVLAKVYRYRKLPDMALDYYNRACVQDTKNFAFQKEYGLYCEQLQQTAKAEQALRRAYMVDGTDAEVTSALARLGIVAGPSLKEKGDLNKPILPKGPIPEVDVNKVKSALGIGGENTTTTPPANTKPAVIPAAGTAATPRD